MKILIIGAGGREHALAWKIAGDSSRPEVFCAPGNAGTANIAENIDISAEDVDSLLAWAVRNRPDLTVVGPEAPLCAGITDKFEAEGLSVFGPSASAARLEGSKLFAKEVMRSAGVPTARAVSFTSEKDALAYVQEAGVPLVVKADGLAAGKGVYVCDRSSQAVLAIKEIMADKLFGEAGRTVVIEEFLRGEEASILALVDGKKAVMLASSQDHKRVFNNDEGPNTGGMGAYSPAPVVTQELLPVIQKEVLDRTLVELGKRGISYKGVLYAGLMMTDSGPKVLEFNCRFGDPETQAILPRIDGDIVPALKACVDGTLDESLIKWHKDHCVSVVIASGGYPGSYEKGKIIMGLERVGDMGKVVIFHAGTKKGADGSVLTAGGRVLNVTALGGGLDDAIDRAYEAISRIEFDQMQYRTDIGAKALRRT